MKVVLPSRYPLINHWKMTRFGLDSGMLSSGKQTMNKLRLKIIQYLD